MTCADALRPVVRRLGCRRGFALNAVLVLTVAATLIVTTSVFLTVAEERSSAAGSERARLAAAADAVIAEMQERLLARVQATSGALRDADLALLNGSAAELGAGLGPSLELELARTGWRVIEVRDGERIPHDEAPLAAWTDQPRLSYAGVPPVGGLVATRTVVVSMYATVRGKDGTYRVRRDLAVSQVPPHQHAVYVQGDAEMCSSETVSNAVGGPVRVDGRLVALSCPHLIRYTGGIEARDGIAADAPAAHFVVGADGQLPLASVSREAAEGALDGVLAPWGGRVRIASALGGAIGPGRLSSASIAGSGECDDVPAAGALACGGAARYFPSVQVQRTTRGSGTEYSAVCGAAYDAGCADVLAAITYVPWPFSGPQPAGLSAPDPAAPGFPWRGLLPDLRRETRCTATVGGHSFRTARCPTNLYGFRIDVSALPPVAGGLMSIRRAAGQASGANPSGAQEIVLLTNGRALAGPLTIHSEIPVYVAGSFNTSTHPAFNGPPPAKIHAPRVVVLPNEAVTQLQTSVVWDSVPPAGSSEPVALPLRAESNVTLYAVIRSGYCGSTGSQYFGGVWEGVPAVLGDWSGAGFRIVGAIEARDVTLSPAQCAAYGAPVGVVPPSGTASVQPASRTVLFDERLLHPAFQPPGGWGHRNMVFTGPAAVPGRSYERQLRAVGGTVVVRRVHDDRRGFPPIPPASSVSAARPLPAAPLPLP